jgi:hypothetical protein
MRHRVRALGGRLDVRSPASGGTLLIVQIPIGNAIAQAAEPAPVSEMAPVSEAAPISEIAPG